MAMLQLLNFDKDGRLTAGSPTVGAEVTDVVLIVHGWHEDQVSAASDYGKLLDGLDEILASEPQRWGDRKAAYLGVIWPSDKYSDDLTVLGMRPEIGGPPPAGLAPGGPPATLPTAELEARAHNVAALLGAHSPTLAAQAIAAATDPAARDGLVKTLQAAAGGRNAFADDQTKGESAPLFTSKGSDLFGAIGHELSQLFASADSGLSSNPLIQWLKHLRGDDNAIVANILNTFAYNELKIRAGVVGSGLAASVLNHLIKDGKRVHLVGHSFGGRLMTAAATHVQGSVANLTLLEGAFSQNALSSDPAGPVDGAYRAVIDQHKVTGRIAALHSENDTAVWIAYPLASRVYRDSYSLGPAGPLGLLFGGPSDRYGAIGANGPENLVGVHQWTFDGASLPGLTPGVHSLECKSFVSAHTDVWKKGSAYAVAAGLFDLK